MHLFWEGCGKVIREGKLGSGGNEERIHTGVRPFPEASKRKFLLVERKHRSTANVHHLNRSHYSQKTKGGKVTIKRLSFNHN